MKKISIVLGAFLTLFLISCEGDQGPPGRDGLPGPEGPPGLAGSTGRVVDILDDFTVDNDYSIFFDFEANGIVVRETEIVLVYLSFNQLEDDNGEPVEVWRLLPQTRILDQGLLQYNYDHTFFDVNIFLEADFDLGTLTTGDTDNQFFRIVILPAEFAQSAKFDKSNLSSVMSSMGISEKDVQTLRMN